MEKPEFEELLRAIGHEFNDPTLLQRAITHSSFANEAGHSEDYERLEFLGDAVLELIVSHMLLDRFPEHKEGELSRLRASAVNRHTLATIARRLGMGEFVQMSRGEEKTGGREKETILADVFEAVIGAIYLDGGLGAAGSFIERYFDLLFAGADERILFTDYKTRLQEASQAQLAATPTYRILETTGPDHDKRFVVEVSIGRAPYGTGTGKSKKEAEQQAAKVAYERLVPEGMAEKDAEE
ncbi:MAG: ribonuclease III [Myxococcales bacterium]|nr:ribonuclease III [Myxococcales bacterium]